MRFQDLEWNIPVYTHPKGVIKFKRYDNKFFWFSEGHNDWIEIEPDYEYSGYEYC